MMDLTTYNNDLPASMQVPDVEAGRKQTFYYRPGMTKEECEVVLRGKPPGTFVVRNSSTLVGGFCVMMRLIDKGTKVTRSYLLETVPQGGVHLRLTSEGVFPTLYDFLEAHCREKLLLPSLLVMPADDWLGRLDPALASRTVIIAGSPMASRSLKRPPPKSDQNQLPRLPPSNPLMRSNPARPPPPPARPLNTSSPQHDSHLTEELPPLPQKPGASRADPQPPERLPPRPLKVTPPPEDPQPPEELPPRPSKPTSANQEPLPPPRPSDCLSSPILGSRPLQNTFEVDEVECELFYFGCMDTWAPSLDECIFQTYLELVEIRCETPNKVSFKMSGQSITIEDKTSKHFVRRHYPIRNILMFDVDPDQRTCKVKKEKKPLSVFGMVMKKPGQEKTMCHLFAARHVEASGIIDAVQSALQLAKGAS